MRSIKYDLGGRLFSTKRGVRLACQDILERFQNDLRLPPAESYFLIELLALHEHFLEKTRNGIIGFQIKTSLPYGTRGFWIEHPGGTFTDFSFHSCITHGTLKGDFVKACRSAVVRDIQAFRNALTWPRLCPFTGETITEQNHHIDHAPPWTFKEIVELFRQTRGNALTYHQECTTHFLEHADIEAFRELHNGKAQLRAVSSQAKTR